MLTVGTKWTSGWYRVSQISGWIQSVPKKYKTIFNFPEISQKLCKKQKWSKSLDLTPSIGQTITPITFFEYTVWKPLVWTIFYLQWPFVVTGQITELF